MRDFGHAFFMDEKKTADYQKMYAMLFNKITDAIGELKEPAKRFVVLQRKREEIYTSANEENHEKQI